jgi:hypothetical protein
MNAPARGLFAIARRLMPRDRRGWTDAMRAEAHYLPAGPACGWALGCLTTSLLERFHMNDGNFRVSRWVMAIETLGCFGPMALAWYEISFGMPGLFRHDWSELMKVYSGMPGGLFMVWMIVLGATVGVVGVIGLALGLRYVLTGRGLQNRTVGCALIAAPLVYALAGIAGFFVGPSDWHSDPAMSILFVLLPVAGIAHLMWLAQPPPAGTVAGLAAS